MACSSGSCESGCYKDKNGEEDQQLGKKKAVNGVVKIGNDLNSTNLCIKCKSNQTIATTIPTAAGDASRFCSDCFRTNLFGKFRFAVTSNAMISPEDNVLVAFSGDTSSRHETYCFKFSSTKKRVPCCLHSEHLFFRFRNGMDTLKELVNTVSDLTGKEDLMLHLLMLSLQKIALQNGYTKLVLGTCTSRIACHVIATTVKEENPSRECTIVRTAGKLTPFHFNRIPEGSKYKIACFQDSEDGT
ncbi:Cytoplasmic tRNA 2-thiolation protein 2 [Camellia lanceoleosa]|uniref:Cytoplasmic tRNA 2-thiolation protein 2 n=1 Tax=Camellia lanceoleosa TaxID=1840588 RepID=A0ACC0FS22_9ERIC|nr:Cytoplasmic tRNA 2-thiolation protein 2 [Camellia lanceoleosa]